jgi:RNA polymerase sigma-70 factor, ECF subfamily
MKPVALPARSLDDTARTTPDAFCTPASRVDDPRAGALADPALAEAGVTRTTALVREHHALVWRTLRRLGVPRDEVDDAAQEVFFTLARRIADVEAGREKSFLIGVALRVAKADRRRGARRARNEGAPFVESPSGLPGPDELLRRARARALLDEALEALPLDVRSVFVLYELEELTMIEVAGLLEVPPGTVASRLRRACELFARGIDELRRRSDKNEVLR